MNKIKRKEYSKIYPLPQCQFTNDKSRVLRKRNYSSSYEEVRESQPLKQLHPTSDRKCPLFTGEFRGSVQV
jgi:hypothetical protein